MAYKYVLSVQESRTIKVKYRKLGIVIPLTLKYSAAIPPDSFRQWAESELIRKFAAGWTRAKGTTSAMRQEWAQRGFTLDVLAQIVNREKASKSPLELIAELTAKAATAQGPEREKIIAELEAALTALKGAPAPAPATPESTPAASSDTFEADDEDEDEDEDEEK